MLRKILNFRVLYRATPLFSFAIHTKYPKINHSPLRGSICSEIKSILHMKKGGQYLPECQLCDNQKLMIFDSKWGVSLVRNIHKLEFVLFCEKSNYVFCFCIVLQIKYFGFKLQCVKRNRCIIVINILE